MKRLALAIFLMFVLVRILCASHICNGQYLCAMVTVFVLVEILSLKKVRCPLDATKMKMKDSGLPFRPSATIVINPDRIKWYEAAVRQVIGKKFKNFVVEKVVEHHTVMVRGRKRIKCQNCKGTGVIHSTVRVDDERVQDSPCSRCHRRGEYYDDREHRLISCPDCGGTGYCWTQYFHNEPRTDFCSRCDGVGSFVDDVESSVWQIVHCSSELPRSLMKLINYHRMMECQCLYQKSVPKGECVNPVRLNLGALGESFSERIYEAWQDVYEKVGKTSHWPLENIWIGIGISAVEVVLSSTGRTISCWLDPYSGNVFFDGHLCDWRQMYQNIKDKVAQTNHDNAFAACCIFLALIIWLIALGPDLMGYNLTGNFLWWVRELFIVWFV